MGVYCEHVLPRLVDWTCGSAGFEPRRARTAEGRTGTVVEIGFGSGLNVPHYPPEVDMVLAVEPAATARHLAQSRVDASSVHVEHVGLDGQHLPLDDAFCDAGPSIFSSTASPLTPVSPSGSADSRRSSDGWPIVAT